MYNTKKLRKSLKLAKMKLENLNPFSTYEVNIGGVMVQITGQAYFKMLKASVEELEDKIKYLESI